MRRGILVMGFAAGALQGLPFQACAGAQIEEPLADAVLSVLSAAVSDRAPPRPVFTTIDDRLAYLRWLGTMSERLKPRHAEHSTRVEFLEALWYESKRAEMP